MLLCLFFPFTIGLRDPDALERGTASRVSRMNAWCCPQDSQPGCSLRSRERDLLFCGDDGLGGLLRLELLEAVECLGESES